MRDISPIIFDFSIVSFNVMILVARFITLAMARQKWALVPAFTAKEALASHVSLKILTARFIYSM
jgi:hypothetical protein